MTRCVDLVTCAAYPDITESDQLLADALRARGLAVRGRAWNDPLDDSADSGDIVVLRSSWDFHTDVAAYERWITRVAEEAVLVNPLPLVRWNLDKRYLVELGEAGAPIPRTAVLDHVERSAPPWVAAEPAVVIKPLVGASGVGVERVAGHAAEQTLAPRLDDHPWMIQEFVADVGGGEWALVFFAGEFSHAFQRVPVAGEFRVNSGFGGTVRAGDPDPALIALGDRTLAALPLPPTYARVDIVVAPGGPVVMEVEVNEPSICLHLHPDAPGRFADAVLAVAGTI